MISVARVALIKARPRAGFFDARAFFSISAEIERGSSVGARRWARLRDPRYTFFFYSISFLPEGYGCVYMGATKREFKLDFLMMLVGVVGMEIYRIYRRLLNLQIITGDKNGRVVEGIIWNMIFVVLLKFCGIWEIL